MKFFSGFSKLDKGCRPFFIIGIFHETIIANSVFLIYPEFRSKFGTTVPDYRGYFLRGLGGNSAGLGIEQGDAIRNIEGEITVMGTLGWDAAMGVFDEGYPNYGNNSGGGGGWWNFHTRKFDASRVVPTANENRPVNKAVKYVIKAR